MAPIPSKRRTLAAVVGALLATAAGQAGAAGFAIIEQGVSGLGNAYAGGAAAAEDATTVFFNPAGLTRIEGTQVVTAGHIIQPSAEFNDGGSALLPFTPFQQPLTGGDGGDAGGIALVPNLYIVTDLPKGLKFGLGINAPFGLKTEYDDDWQGRYQAVESDLKTVNINPTLAFPINAQWSAGIGVNIQYAEALLSNAIDFGTICTLTEAGGGLPPGTCAAFGLSPQQNDGFGEVEGDNWAFGYNAGLLWQPTENTRFGLAYRSRIEQTLKGDADFTVPAEAAFLTGGGSFTDTDARAAVTLPETLSLSAYHKINDRWAIMGDVTLTRWEHFQELRVEYESPQDDTVVHQNWENSLRWSLGVNYFLDSRWTLRGGVAIDESPIPSAEYRTPRIPGNDRTWVTIGASYMHNEHLRFDVGYAHLFVEDSPIAHAGATGDYLFGTFENTVDILSAQVVWTP